MRKREREREREAMHKHVIKPFPRRRYAGCHDMCLKDTVKRKLKRKYILLLWSF